MNLGLMTTTEVREAIESGMTTAILPVGATEQHGAHLALATDTLTATLVAEKLAEKLGAIVAPAVPYGMSANHRRFAGTITLSTEVLQSIVRDICISVARSGFRHLIIVNGHMGNYPAIVAGARDAKQSSDLLVSVSNYWNALRDTFQDLAGSDYTGNFRSFAGHGALMEVSLVLAATGDSISLDEVSIPGIELLEIAEDPALTLISDVEQVSPSGVYGDLGHPTAELGERIAEAVATELARKAQRLAEIFGGGKIGD